MDEKIRIVDDLQQAGIFYMKGAVSEGSGTAGLLGGDHLPLSEQTEGLILALIRSFAYNGKCIIMSTIT